MRLLKYLWIMIFELISIFAYSQKDIIEIKYSEIAPEIDGIISVNEWIDADSVIINRTSKWQIKVLMKHDLSNFYLAFIDMVKDTNQVIAEVLMEPDINADTLWHKNTLWFHASYSDCFQSGGYFNWSTCSKTKTDWSANNLPFQKGDENIEFKINISKLKKYNLGGLDQLFRIAFDVGDKYDNISYWPENAIISNPSTWGYAKFESPTINK